MNNTDNPVPTLWLIRFKVCWWNMHVYSLTQLTQIRLEVSAVSGPSMKFFKALWSDAEPFIQFLGQLLGLSTFWIPLAG